TRCTIKGPDPRSGSHGELVAEALRGALQRNCVVGRLAGGIPELTGSLVVGVLLGAPPRGLDFGRRLGCFAESPAGQLILRVRSVRPGGPRRPLGAALTDEVLRHFLPL